MPMSCRTFLPYHRACPAERSEASQRWKAEILHFVQDDMGGSVQDDMASGWRLNDEPLHAVQDETPSIGDAWFGGAEVGEPSCRLATTRGFSCACDFGGLRRYLKRN